ncbi:restriction endonuclease subunit S [Burkholderia pseudomallei]|uniref:restriction endonuclease subunit S n=2 Tax=Burkholderia pseudomallei TaxID=28450 RepID=UPI00190FAEDA|nr:restriction endonuclease subunit S [Burkholderia pseudomallei]
MPSLDEQLEITRWVELFFAYADRLEKRFASARDAADRFTPALLAKAFRGELVPQDPNDEPAVELLKRLVEQRSGAGGAVKRKRAKGATQKVSSEPKSLVTS